MPEIAGDVFIGQGMRIVSQMNVRYEGVLASVDATNRTVTLQRVRCYGTEDRPAELKVLPIQEIFDEITFKVCSIKEMFTMPSLDEKKTFVLNSDPAVVSIETKKLWQPYNNRNKKFNQGNWHDRKDHQERKYTPAKTNWSNGPAKPQFYAYHNKFYSGQSWNKAGAGKDEPKTLPGSAFMPFRRPEPFKPREYVKDYLPKLFKEAFATPAKQESALSLSSLAREVCAKPAASSSDTDSGISVTPDDKLVKEEDRAYQHASLASATGKKFEPNGYKKAPYGRPFGFAPTNNFSHRPTYGKPRVGPHQFHARPGQHQHKFPQKVPKFNSDYDFETANKKFEEIAIGDLKDQKDDKPEVVQKSADVKPVHEDVEQKKVFYEKKGFFDDISSDDKDRRSGKDVRPDWQTQRKTDSETFGPGVHAVVNRHAGHNKIVQLRHQRAQVAAQ
ncbi:LSM14-B protein [Aphelenchoides avenae]|nr:LSM14-B protein [Aphelenchus avenae]